MHFGLSDDQIFFQDNVKKFLEENAPLDTIKKISNGDDSVIKDDLHKGIVNLGINNILIPEENGGLGLDLLFLGFLLPLVHCFLGNSWVCLVALPPLVFLYFS